MSTRRHPQSTIATISDARNNALTIGVAVSALLALALFARYANEPVTMTDLLRVGTLMPYAGETKLGIVALRAAEHGFGFINQFIVSIGFTGDSQRATSNVRIWDGLAAALAVLWLYRVGSMCTDRATGLAGCLALALVPPRYWGVHALQVFLVLLQFESFIYAVRKNNALRWATCATTTFLLFCAGVFAEPFLLQTWMLGLGAIWVTWSLCARRLERHRDINQHYHHPHDTNISHKLQRDAGMIRLVSMIITAAIITSLMFFLVGVVFSKFAVTSKSLLAMLLISFAFTLLSGVILLMMPLFSRERRMLLERMHSGLLVRSLIDPDSVFRPIALRSLFHALLVYAIVSCLFLPVLFHARSGMSLFVSYCDVGLLADYLLKQGTPVDWVSLAAPFVFIALNILGYVTGMLTRGRIIGAAVLFIPTCLYLVQQRYAVFSMPFCIVCSVGCITTAVTLAMHAVKRPVAKRSHAKVAV